MICKKCGNEININDKVCAVCGAEVEIQTMLGDDDPAFSQGVPSDQPQYAQQYNAGAVAEDPAERALSKSILIFGILATRSVPHSICLSWVSFSALSRGARLRHI